MVLHVGTDMVLHVVANMMLHIVRNMVLHLLTGKISQNFCIYLFTTSIKSLCPLKLVSFVKSGHLHVITCAIWQFINVLCKGYLQTV